MSKTEPKTCLSCGNEDSITGKPCQNRGTCFFPKYKHWVPIIEEDKENPGWKINYLTFDNENNHVTISLSSLSGECIMVELSPNEIAKLAQSTP